MGIAIRPDQSGDFDTVTANDFGEIGNDREARHDLEFSRRSLRHQDWGKGEKAYAGSKT
jgi:hypothetical protein